MVNHVRRRRPRRRVGRWAVLLIGIVGLMAGLFYAWFVNPVDYVDAEPAQLSEEQQRTYLILVSLAYAADNDLTRARIRLGAMGLSDDPGERLASVADEAVTRGLADRSVQALTNLALVLGGEPELSLAFAGTLPPPPTLPPTVPPPTVFLPPTSTPVPSLTPTPFPTITPDPTLGTPTPSRIPDRAEFVLVDRTPICDGESPSGLLAVTVEDEFGEGLSGTELLVEWEGGQDSFFTGLKPEEGPGFADFTMTEERVYTLRVLVEGTSASDDISDFQTSPCDAGEEFGDQLLGYEVVFRQR